MRDFIHGPWRAVTVLGITQLLAWAVLYYPPVLVVPLIAAERGFSATFAMSGLSAGLLVAGFVSPTVGRLVDRYGGHRVMPFGSLLGALGLVLMGFAANPLIYLAVWMLLGVAMAGSLYDPAFASLGRIFGARARPAITALTLIGGFASTVGWPATHALLQAIGWHKTYLVYAALLVLVAAPLNAFALPTTRAEPEVHAAGSVAKPTAVRPASGLVFFLVVAAFAAYAFVPSGLAAHLIAIFGRLGLDATTVVLVGALFGPAQVLARICEFAFARHVHPLWISRLAVALLLLAFVLVWIAGLSTPTAIMFAVMFGAANGLMTIARGTVPLVLFGAAGYGRTIGRIAGPALVVQALAPVVLAFAAERASDPIALALVAAFAAVALVCFSFIRPPAA